MAKIVFSERQSFRQIVWIWVIIIPVAFLSVLGISLGFYQQIIQGEPWGNEPMSDGGLIAMLLVAVIAQALAIWIVSSLELKIEITREEFRYRFFAYFTGWNTLTRDQISAYSVEKYSFWKGKGIGYRKNIITKSVRMIIRPASILTLRTKEGKTLMLSTENKEDLERAMHKLMSKSENF